MTFRMKNFQLLSDFETKFLQRLRFQIIFITTRQILKQNFHNVSVIEVGVEVTGVEDTCFKIGYSSREPRRVLQPCIKIEYSSAMY